MPGKIPPREDRRDSHRVEELAVHYRQRPRVQGRDEGGLRVGGYLLDALQVRQRHAVQALLWPMESGKIGAGSRRMGDMGASGKVRGSGVAAHGNIGVSFRGRR